MVADVGVFYSVNKPSLKSGQYSHCPFSTKVSKSTFSDDTLTAYTSALLKNKVGLFGRLTLPGLVTTPIEFDLLELPLD